MNQPIPLDHSRRSFLRLGAGTALAASFSGLLSARAADDDAGASEAADKKKSTAASRSAEYGGLPMGIQSYTLRSMAFDKALETIASDLKLTYVEIFPGHHPGLTPPQVKEKLDAKGLRASAYGVVPFKKDIEANRRYFVIGKALGIKSLSCDPDPDSFDSLDKLVEEYQIAAAIHPHGPGHRWAMLKTVHDAVKDHHKLIGLCNDTGHLIRADQDPVEACQMFHDRMYGVHFKDFKKLDNGKWEDCVLGDGKLDVEALTKTLIQMKFNGALSLEYEGGDPVTASKKCLDRVKQAAKKTQSA
jgi:sugar phosphate isomerase/epimerase